MTTPNMHGAAAWFAARGLRVYPLQPNTAFWALGDWQRNATTDLRYVDSWWNGRGPQAKCNIAIVGLAARWGDDGETPWIARVKRNEDQLYWVVDNRSWVVAPPSIVDGSKTEMIEWKGLPDG